MNTENALLSIGALSRISGVGIETLRNWERRYGFPKPIRLDSGHRRYPSDMIARLRLIRRAIELGFKPSYAVLAPAEELEGLVREAEREVRSNEESSTHDETKQEIAEWMETASRLDAYSFEVILRRAWSQYGARDFIVKLAVPFLEQVGKRWFEQRFSVAHEHFTSENLISLLSAQWRPISKQATTGKAVVANLENEHHHLGIHMASVFLALNDFEIIFLGPNTPVDDIILTTQEPGVVTTVIGLSETTDIERAELSLRKLRAAIPASITLVVGGNDELSPIKGITHISTLDQFADFTRSLADIYRGSL
jgi:MerR family transcriptional regulator, light-induced transcriptional regulator